MNRPAPGTCTRDWLGSSRSPKKRAMPVMPSLPTVATSADMPFCITVSTEQTPLSGKHTAVIGRSGSESGILNPSVASVRWGDSRSNSAGGNAVRILFPACWKVRPPDTCRFVARPEGTVNVRLGISFLPCIAGEVQKYDCPAVNSVSHRLLPGLSGSAATCGGDRCTFCHEADRSGAGAPGGRQTSDRSDGRLSGPTADVTPDRQSVA